MLARLAVEADDGGAELRRATIWDVQRMRPVINGTARLTKKRNRLGMGDPERHLVLTTVSLTQGAGIADEREQFAAADLCDQARRIEVDPFVDDPVALEVEHRDDGHSKRFARGR